MSKAWGGRYSFESGEEVKIKSGHPYAGRHGIVIDAHATHQLKVHLPGSFLRQSIDIVVFDDVLELLPVAFDRRNNNHEPLTGPTNV